MRMFLSILALVCSLHLAVAAPKEPEMFEIDSFDYGTMLQVSSSIMQNQFGSRLEEIMNQGGGTKLVPADDNEKMALVIAYTYFLIAITRIRQEVVCLADQTNAQQLVDFLWKGGAELYTVLPEDVRREAISIVMEWIEQHGEDEWRPTENIEQYIDMSEYSELRRIVAQNDYQILGQKLLVA